MSIIFYHNEEQKNAVLESMRSKSDSLGQKIATAVIPFSQFFLAEDYHQKYYLQGTEELYSEFADMYPAAGQLIQSTAVARVNGYIGGYGKLESLQNIIDLLGLSKGGKEKLLQIGRSSLACQTN
jgi:peptide-methionine (S)-S-oxide reductase